MTARPDRIGRLREAFAGMPWPEVRRDRCPAAEELWDAANGALRPEASRRVVRHVAECAGCAEEWRLAMRGGSGAGERFSTTSTSARLSSRWLAVAAVAASLVLGTVVLIQSPTDDLWRPSFRSAERVEIRSMTPDARPLPRHDGALEWSSAGPGARYDLEVSLESLEPLLTERGLESTRFVLPESVLARVPEGGRIVWRVEAHLPDGGRMISPAFVDTVE
jgi:hypothetical protein